MAILSALPFALTFATGSARSVNVGPKRLWGKKKRFALIGVAVAVLVGVGWLVWPDRTQDLGLRLKIVRYAVQDGTPGVLFRVEGAENYEILVTGYSFCPGGNSPHSTFGIHNYTAGREFFVSDPQSYMDVGDKGWRLQADAWVLPSHQSKFSKLVAVTRDAWRARNAGYDTIHPSFFSTAKFFWNANSRHILSQQTLTSELITNTPHH